ncbi:MAG TPA: trypsin-like peptidase domain-containing protein [Sandaracinaceae bacterium LLY-WYZ-13_1]|nr:trypsin-like peptidase domain-containing protein [Sandaracinaceae bacterium LLY-WYZ-13_1]
MARRRSPWLWALVATALVALSAACTSGVWLWLVGLEPSPPAEVESVVVTARGDLSDAETSTVELFRHAAPSVVYITKLTVRADPFRRNFLEIPEGTGSGFLWDRRGHVVTNFHVIEGADGARVTLADQSTWPAELVGYVAEKDIAVLRIDGPEELLRPVPVGTSHDLVVGQHVFAIGNPFGLDHTLSTGVVSGLEREILSVTRRPITGVIQTDAAINPGNSGGPLLDSAGRLIGMNTAIYSPSGASAGIGFAVPVDTIARIVPQLIAHGRVIRPALGVQLADPRRLGRLGLAGALVLGVQPGSPAARAGLRPTRRDRYGRLLLGDLIVAIDGETVAEPNDIYRILDRHEVGDTVRLTYQRGDQRSDVQLQLAGVTAE